jgi:hypothetical protein
MPPATLYGWIYKHWVDATFKDRWIIHADTAELARLRKLRDQHQPGARGQRAGNPPNSHQALLLLLPGARRAPMAGEAAGRRNVRPGPGTPPTAWPDQPMAGGPVPD